MVGRSERGFDPATIGRAVILLILMVVSGDPSGIVAGTETGDSSRDTAVFFCRHFLDGDDEGVRKMMTERMRQALVPAVAEQVRAG